MLIGTDTRASHQDSTGVGLLFATVDLAVGIGVGVFRSDYDTCMI
jgi:hypothetical protein